MKMPIFLPPELSQLANATNDIDLFAQVTTNPNRLITFLEAALDDVTWSEQHIPLIKRLIRYITEFFYSGQLSIAGAERIKKILHTSFGVAFPYLHYDITLKINNNNYPANSLLIAAASPYFNDRIRVLTANQEHEMNLQVDNPQSIELILNLLHKGTEDLHRYTEEELFIALEQLPAWGLTELADQTEMQLIQYLKLSTIEESLHEARKHKWAKLEKAAVDIYNELYPGLHLIAHAPNQLTAIFYDLKILTTIVQYEKVATLVSRCQFKDRLLEDSTLETVIKMTPNLKGLDFSETTQPLFNDSVLPKKLEYLNLTRAIWLNDALFVDIVMQCSQLKHLVLQDVHWLGFESWGAISTLMNLTHLDLLGMRQLQDDAFFMIILNPGNIESINLAGCRSLTPQAFQEFIKVATGLLSLNVAKTSFDDQCLSDAASRLYRLETINISGCKFISDRALESFRKQKPHVRELG